MFESSCFISAQLPLLHKLCFMYENVWTPTQKILSQQLDSMNKKLSDHRLQSAKLASQVETN